MRDGKWFRMHWELALDSGWLTASLITAMTGLVSMMTGNAGPALVGIFGFLCYLMGHLRGSIAHEELVLELRDAP